MKQFTNFLQHPLLNMFVSPLATILYGTLVGALINPGINWLGLLLLALIVISSYLILHYFNLQKNRNTTMNQGILYACEAILIISVIAMAFSNHWLITILLVLYVIYIHIIYFPYNISGTWYHLILSVAYNAIFLNVVAHFVQSNQFDIAQLTLYIPLVLFFLGMQFEVFQLQSRLNQRKNQIFYHPWLGMGMMILGILTGFYFAVPSTTYYIVQILFVIVSGISLLPLIVSTQKSHQRQNKINYLSAVYLVFAILYALSLVY